jgi:hypothetical protein
VRDERRAFFLFGDDARRFCYEEIMTDPTPQPAVNPAPADPTPAQPPASSAATLTQEQFNAALAEEKRKWKAQQDAAAAEIKRKADEAAAAEKGEFEKLATDRATRIAALEAEHTTAAEQLTKYQEEMERQIKARLRALPEEIRAMAPEGDALMRFAWLEKAEQAAQKLAATRTPGTPPGPRGSGAVPAANPTDLIAQKRASGDYAL